MDSPRISGSIGKSRDKILYYMSRKSQTPCIIRIDKRGPQTTRIDGELRLLQVGFGFVVTHDFHPLVQVDNIIDVDPRKKRKAFYKGKKFHSQVIHRCVNRVPFLSNSA